MAKAPPGHRSHVWEFTSSRLIIGVDEVGVGPIAGPIYACALILRPEISSEALPFVRDSKKMSTERREQSLHPIRDASLHWACRSSWDTENILKARLQLMASCVRAVARMYERSGGQEIPLVVVDGNLPLPGFTDQVCLVKGDDRCLTVACASVVAKVLRDRYMETLHHEHPQYGWLQNMGYATSEHLKALEKHGLSPYHRELPSRHALENWKQKKGST